MYSSTVGRRMNHFAREMPAPGRWCELRQRIAAVARAEHARWTPPGGRKLTEGDPGQVRVLTQYWSAVPGFGSATAAEGAAQRSAAHDPDYPWSAAFICFVMRAAGVRLADGFVFGPRHMEYIVGALRNRERSDRTRPFWLVDHIELAHEVAPESGDLLCFNRGTSQYTYASLRSRFWSGGHQNVPTSGISHCRIVVGASSSGGRRSVVAIGGNESDSVRLTRIPADQFGHIQNPGTRRIFGMIKLIECRHS